MSFMSLKRNALRVESSIDFRGSGPFASSALRQIRMHTASPAKNVIFSSKITKQKP
jgi:hypothetical protein